MAEVNTNSRVQGLIDYCKANKDVPFLAEMVDGYPGLTERNKKEIKYFAKLKIKGLMELAKTLKGAEEDEIDSGITGVWFEFRSQWIRHNAVNNYNMITHGEADPLFVLQSAVLSHYLAGIEEFIPEEKLTKMNEIMVNIQYNGI